MIGTERKDNMPVVMVKEGNTAIAYLSGEIDHHSAALLREEIDFSVEQTLPETLILDFNKVTFMDSSGIGLVMGRYKLMQSIGGQVRVENPKPRIKKMMELSGLKLLDVL